MGFAGNDRQTQSGVACERDACPADTILVTDTIPRREPAPERLKVVSVGPLLSRAIRNLHEMSSISALFDKLDEGAS